MPCKFPTLTVILTILSSYLTILSGATLTVTQPTTAHYWVGNSSNTLAWSGTTPTQFSVFIYNPDVNLLTDKLAIFAVVDTYITSLSLTPTAPAGQGYTLQLTDIINSTNVYATSEPFEIVPQGSAYPVDTSPSAVASGSGSGKTTNTATGTAMENGASQTASDSAVGTATATGQASSAEGASGRMRGRWAGALSLVAIGGVSMTLIH